MESSFSATGLFLKSNSCKCFSSESWVMVWRFLILLSDMSNCSRCGHAVPKDLILLLSSILCLEFGLLIFTQVDSLDVQAGEILKGLNATAHQVQQLQFIKLLYNCFDLGGKANDPNFGKVEVGKFRINLPSPFNSLVYFCDQALWHVFLVCVYRVI